MLRDAPIQSMALLLPDADVGALTRVDHRDPRAIVWKFEFWNELSLSENIPFDTETQSATESLAPEL
jgi:hypothetical protein